MTINGFWQLLAGLAIFLYGMFETEDALKKLAGRTFKIFLKKHTDNKLSAILSGAAVTGVLQSSSVVTLMVLSFVGAGVISMRNALAVVFGSNLGTTFDSWIVAALGFKLNIESFALPIIGISGLCLMIFSKKQKVQVISKFFMGFGLLFLGLSFMKESIGAFLNGFDFTPYLQYNSLVFILIGFVITALIQSSSATMVITLSALNTGALPFEMAVAVVIGSELGTTIKLIIGSVGGVSAKKRVAFGNILFNIVITLFAWLLMHPIIAFITRVLGITEPLIGLVAFQTLINLCGIVIFFPFIRSFGDFLERMFTKKESHDTYFISDISAPVAETAVEILEKESLLFIHRVVRLNLEAFHVEPVRFNNVYYPLEVQEQERDPKIPYQDKYDHVKQIEGEILSFYSRLSETAMEKEDWARLNKIIASVRNAMYSAKGIKDIRTDRIELRESAVDIKFEYYKMLQKQVRSFYLGIIDLMNEVDPGERYNSLVELLSLARNDYEVRLKEIYRQSGKAELKEMDVSTLLNVSRELYSSSKAMLFALKDHLLQEPEADKYENLPVVV